MARKAAAPRLSERQIQDTCLEWLLHDGWLRQIHTDLRHLRGMGVQELGIPDDCVIRYYCPTSGRQNHGGVAQVIWIEWKARDGKVGDKQREWHQLERARGGLVWVAKQDFEPTIEGFQEHYRKSGLLQRSGL